MSAWVQDLDFTKKLGLQIENVFVVCFLFVCLFFFFFLFLFFLLLFFFFRLCAMYAFYHLYVCLSFRTNLMLSINYLYKRDPLEILHPKLENSRPSSRRGFTESVHER